MRLHFTNDLNPLNDKVNMKYFVILHKNKVGFIVSRRYLL